MRAPNNYMIPLFSCCPYIDQIISVDDPKPFCDKEIPFGLQAFAILAATELPKRKHPNHYIFAPHDLIAYWQKELAQDNNFKVGLCWNSSLFGYYFSGTSKTLPVA